MDQNGDNALRGKKLSLPQFLALLERKSLIPDQFTVEQAKEKFASYAVTDQKSLYFTEFRACMHSFYESDSSQKPRSSRNRASRDSKRQSAESPKKNPNLSSSAQAADTQKSFRGPSADVSRKSVPAQADKAESQPSKLIKEQANKMPDSNRDQNRSAKGRTSDQREDRESTPTRIKEQAQNQREAAWDGGPNQAHLVGPDQDRRTQSSGKSISRGRSAEDISEMAISRASNADRVGPEAAAVKIELDIPFDEVNSGDVRAFCTDLVVDLSDALAVNWDRIQVLEVSPADTSTIATVKFLPGEFDNEATPIQLIDRLNELVQDESDENWLFNGDVTRFLLEVGSPISVTPVASRDSSAHNPKSINTAAAPSHAEPPAIESPRNRHEARPPQDADRGNRSRPDDRGQPVANGKDSASRSAKAPPPGHAEGKADSKASNSGAPKSSKRRASVDGDDAPLLQEVPKGAGKSGGRRRHSVAQESNVEEEGNGWPNGKGSKNSPQPRSGGKSSGEHGPGKASTIASMVFVDDQAQAAASPKGKRGAGNGGLGGEFLSDEPSPKTSSKQSRTASFKEPPPLKRQQSVKENAEMKRTSSNKNGSELKRQHSVKDPPEVKKLSSRDLAEGKQQQSFKEMPELKRLNSRDAAELRDLKQQNSFKESSELSKKGSNSKHSPDPMDDEPMQEDPPELKPSIKLSKKKSTREKDESGHEMDKLKPTASIRPSNLGSMKLASINQGSADEGGKWKVLFNDDNGNTEEHARSKKQGTEIHRNSVTTSKYTFYNFLFLNLGQQFSRLANVYFLIIAGLQLFTPLSPTGRYSTAAPLALVVAANMVREIWEDSKRHKDDREVNHRQVEVIKGGKVETSYWKDLKVGDIVCVKKGNELPADVVQLSSSDEQGGSYIDTCNLDGETNLKIKSSLSATKYATSTDKVSGLSGTIDYEAPNKRLYTFVGTATLNGDKVPVDNDCVLLRGSVLRNTTFIYGIVVYAGKQSKIQMNSKAAAIKRSNVEKMANWILAGVLVFELVMCSLGCIGNAVWAKANPGVWYMPYSQSQTTVNVLQAWVTYFILLNNYVPISLYVSMELAKLGQKLLMDNDIEMYHELTDTPCLARTSNLNEELGQIQYIFSDKTGTLTRNEMEFRKCWIAGTSYGFGTTEIGQAAAARGALLAPSPEEEAAQRDANPQRAQYFYDAKVAFDDVRIRTRLETRHRDAEAITDFLRVLSVAHTVVPEGDADGNITPQTIKFQAESPDEGALVMAAKVLGFFFCGKTATTHTINVFGELQTFEILNINKFNSTRKRMSAVVRTPEGQLELYIKGADNVMFERLSADSDQGPIEAAVKLFGQEGLRTLIIAKRVLSEEEYEEWNQMHRDASTALSGREEALMEAAEAIERDLEIVGATAIEDKLQIGVPEAIATLARARIRIWVLTGDKQETAENIGFACNLLTDGMERVYLVQESYSELRQTIADAVQKYERFAQSEDPCEELSLLVDGKALLIVMKAVENDKATAEDMELMMQFLALARMCKAVIACRVSPDQKRQIVAMVKLHSTPVPLTLAIGDGANDVPMILEASVGVGISGNEGMQAVRSADYAIAQFAYLKRLLLVHGRSNYKRISTVVMYSLYKNSFLVTTLFLYGFYTGWTGTALYDSLMLAGYNVGWAFIGIILYGTIENDVSPAAALLFPQLYMTGVRKEDFNMWVLIKWEGLAFIHTVICLLIPTYCYMGTILRRSGEDDGQTVFGMCVLQSLVIAVNIKLLIKTANLAVLSLVAYIGGIILFMFGGLTHSVWGLSSFFATEQYVFYNIMPFLYATPTTWLIQLLTVVVIILPEFMFAYYRRTYHPTPADIVREVDQKLGDKADINQVAAALAAGRPAGDARP